MTDREKVVVMAYTGVCTLASDKLGLFYRYVQDKLGHCVMTHELAYPEVQDAIKEESRDDFIELCKSSDEPCVMTVDEVRTWVSTPRIDREPIWVEIENGVSAWIVSDEYWDMPIDANLSSDLYGKTWRCWTSRPTEAQREATPWQSDIARSAEES